MPRFNTTANGLASLGRNGDTMLMHVNPNEVAGLSALLGSEPTVNPDTGLPEAFSWLSPIMGVLGSAASLVNSAAIQEPLEELLGESELLKDFAGPLSLVGSSLAGAATNAGIGALGAGLSGGNAGDAALAGALSGGAAGLYGGLESENILGKPPQTAEQTMDDLFYEGPEAAPYSPMGATQAPSFGDTYLNNLGRAWDQNVTREGGFKNFVSEHGKPLMLAGTMQAGLEQNFGADEYAKKQKERQMRLFADAGVDPFNLMRSYSFTTRGTGYADGGAVGYATEFGLPTQVKIPERYIDELQKAGGIGALAITNPQYAHGGYINTKPFNPQEHYPQSMIEKAKPYSAAAPQRHEVVDSYEDGGFVEGDGDGMSDDVDAILEGEEEIRVADGEVIIPKAIVDMFGVDALDNMLKRVRMAAYGTDKQVKQDAGKEVVLDMLD